MSLQVLERPKEATVEASLLYLEPSGARPRLEFSYEAGTAETAAIYTPHSVRIGDARAIAPSLDVEGFELVRHRTAVHEFRDEAQVSGLGRAEAARIVADATGASRVHVFDHTLRRRAADSPRQPSTRVHVDYTVTSAPRRVRDLLGSEADQLLRRRVAFVNVWRPIRWPAHDWPLALCDARSVAPNELVATDIVYPDRSGEIYGVSYSPRHRWHYVPDMQLDEALLIKCYDSATDVARFTPHTAFENPRTPHTAFENPRTPPGAPPRESVEFRAIAFFD